MIPIKCQGCQAEFNLKDELAGKKGKCPNCSTVFDIPGGIADPDKIEIICKCGANYKLDKGLAGKKGKCNKCGEIFEIVDNSSLGENIAMAPKIESNPSPENIFSPGISAKFTPGESISKGLDKSGVYSHSKYGIKQKKLAINEKYYIKDKDNNEIMFSIRRTYMLKGILAFFSGLTAGFLVFSVLSSIFITTGKIGDIEAFFTTVVIGFFILCFSIFSMAIVMIAIFPKRHIEFHKSESDEKGLPEFIVEQNSKWEIITKNYTLRDANGNLMAKFRKNLFTDILRKTWHIHFGSKHIVVKEDSIILGLLRRLSPISGLIRTNFIFVDVTSNPKSNEIIGYFKRKFELFDNYVLDLNNDSAFGVPRQIALCMAVLLDSGERR